MTELWKQSFADALPADGPLPERADKLALYGRFVGDWALQATIYDDTGQIARRGTGEVHFAWVLQGRGVQDVWIQHGLFYGTTLRLYDPGLDAWHIFWNDPVQQIYCRQLARAQGPDIVQKGPFGDGATLRWSFTEITPASFRWLGEQSGDDGASWRPKTEYRATRVNGG